MISLEKTSKMVLFNDDHVHTKTLYYLYAIFKHYQKMWYCLKTAPNTETDSALLTPNLQSKIIIITYF